MTINPVCMVQDGANPFVTVSDGVDVTSGVTISVKLASATGVTGWFLEVVGTDGVSTIPTLVGVDSSTHKATLPSTVVTFTFPGALGRSVGLRSTVTGAGGPITTTFGVYSLTALSNRVPYVVTQEVSTNFGWASKINTAIRAISTFLSGSGTPNLLTGSVGDFYIDTASSSLYGPKQVSSWGTSISLRGPGVPDGGTNGQILSKLGETDYSTQWVNPSGVGMYSSMYLAPPSNPDALNDEFLIGSGDLATRGWTCVVLGTNTPMTYAGPVDPYSNVELALNTYRASITSGGLVLRSNPDMYVYKALSGNFCVSLISTWARHGGTSTTIRLLAVEANNPPSLSTSRYVIVAQDGVGSAPGVLTVGDMNVGYGSQALGFTWGSPMKLSSTSLPMAWLDWKQSTNSLNATIVEATSGRTRFSLGPVTFASFAPTNVGFAVTTTSSFPKVFAIVRAFRVYPQGTWPGI